MIFITAIIGALSNSFLRGSDLVRGGRYINAVLFGAGAYLNTDNYLFGISMCLAMAIGQLWAIPHDQTLEGNWKPMFFRGVIWALPLMTVMGYFYHFSALFYIPALLLMYPIYRGADLFFETHKFNKFFNQVKVAEYIYGALLWFPLALGVKHA